MALPTSSTRTDPTGPADPTSAAGPTAAPGVPETAPETAPGPPWPLLVVLLVGQFMALLDVSIVNVALPAVGRDLAASGAALQLIVSGFIISYAMLLITGARLGSTYGIPAVRPRAPARPARPGRPGHSPAWRRASSR